VNGINAVPISLDDYYFERDKIPRGKDGNPDYETLEAINYGLFNENINDLINGKEVTLPRYDFDTAKLIPNAHTLSLKKHEVIIVEGIHGLNPKLAAEIDDDRKFKIYCTALTGITDDNGVRIKSSTTRKIRRIIRDSYFRGADWSETLALWPNQEYGSEKYIFPYTDSADVLFNSSLLYEFCVYREHLEKLLENADNEETEALLELVGQFLPIEREYTPSSSIIREFVGGSTLWQ
jgi:uridine kinase